MRNIKAIHKAESHPIQDLKTFRPMPTAKLQHLDPFLFLNHHGRQTYPPNNSGLPFGPHPHRGMETVTFILEGDIMHEDSGGHKSVIGPGGVQYMTAGKGLIHAEVSSKEFKEKGGELEILQLWLNLPAKLKMTEPNYVGKQSDEIPLIELDKGKTKVQLLFGQLEKGSGAFEPNFPLLLATLHLQEGGQFERSVPEEENIFLYVVRGAAKVNEEEVPFRHLVEFGHQGEDISIEATDDAIVLFGHAKPFGEPIVAQGPFVMNSQQEIAQAFRDYQEGKFGSWD